MENAGLVRIRGTIDRSPRQPEITKKRIQEMIAWSPRRCQLATQWPKRLYEPKSEDENWRLILPFCETFRNAFNSMCHVRSNLHVVKNDRCFTFLNDAKENEETIRRVQDWLQTIEEYVVIRDCLALSFALDYNHEGGDPNGPKTRIGALVVRAKPYDNQPTSDTYVAADELVEECLNFLKKVNCYDSAEVIVAMPPSRHGKQFDLPTYLAAGIAKRYNLEDLSSAVRTVKDRPPIKNSKLEDKFKVLEGTIAVDQEVFQDKAILLVDDLYQSGVSMNYVAMLLLEAGADKVFGLACEKTCTNDDNLSGEGKSE